MVPATNTTTMFRRCMSSPPHYHVPLYLQRRFKGYLEKAEKKQKEEEEKDRIFRQAHDCSFSNKEQIEKSEKSVSLEEISSRM